MLSESDLNRIDARQALQLSIAYAAEAEEEIFNTRNDWRQVLGLTGMATMYAAISQAKAACRTEPASTTTVKFNRTR